MCGILKAFNYQTSNISGVLKAVKKSPERSGTTPLFKHCVCTENWLKKKKKKNAVWGRGGCGGGGGGGGGGGVVVAGGGGGAGGWGGQLRNILY